MEEGVGDSIHQPLSMRIARAYLKGLHRVRYPLLMTWVILTGVFATYAAQFPSDVTSTISAPHDSQAYKASEVYKSHFPAMQRSEGMIIYARSKLRPFSFTNTSGPYVNFDLQMLYWLYTRKIEPNVQVIGYLLLQNQLNAKWVVSTYASYFTTALLLPTLPWSYNGYAAEPGGYSVFSTITYDKSYKGDDAVDANEFSQELMTTIDTLLKLNNLQDEIVVTPLGLSPFLNELTKSTTRDMALLFGLFTPLSLLVFALSIGSVRILVLPFAALCGTTSLTFGLMHFVASSMDIDSTSPGVAGLLCLGLSVCFAYTFAAKFHRETLDQNAAFGRGRSLVVLELVLAYSGRTIFVSGLTIVFCSMGIIFFPIGMLKSIGLTCVVASLSALIVSLNFVPVILTCWPTFFERGVGDWTWPRFGPVEDSLIKRNRGGAGAVDDAALLGAVRGDVSVLSDNERTPPRQQQRPAPAAQPATTALSGGALDGPEGPSVLYVHRHDNSAAESHWDPHDTRASIATRESQRVLRERYFYRYFVAFLAQWQVALPCILIAVGLSMYPMTQADDTAYSNNIDQFMPKDSSLLPEFNFMSQTFRAGEVFQYYMVIRYDFLTHLGFNEDTPANGTLLVSQTFTVGQGVIADLVAELPNTPPQSFDAFFYSGLRTPTREISQEEYYACYPYFNTSDSCRYLAIFLNLFLAEGRGPYAWVQVRLDINPLSVEGKDWYEAWKALAPKLNAKYGITLYLQGYAADSIDTVAFANDKFPVVVGIVMAILFVSIGLMTFSIGIPARALTTVGITWATTSGLANIVYCHGALYWVPLDGLKSTGGALAWLVPFTTLMLVTGLSLHYDMSLVLRVQQFYHHGFDTCSSIVLAAQETGSEISVGAGMMMLLFSGLLLSEVPVMNQLAFYLVMVAFLQGIVYRLFLSTTFMAMLNDWNWFPYNLTRQAQEPCEEPLVGTEAHVALGAQRESAAIRHSLAPAESPRVHGNAVQPLTSNTSYGTA